MKIPGFMIFFAKMYIEGGDGAYENIIKKIKKVANHASQEVIYQKGENNNGKKQKGDY